ncbi:MAG: alkaline phosphatase D family protein, partial [Bdellovibrionales bacterium]|nr:alkaline phosphatase D family protein [Bdellovibrionales bacterium]
MVRSGISNSPRALQEHQLSEVSLQLAGVLNDLDFLKIQNSTNPELPQIPFGVSSGDVRRGRASIQSSSDRPAYMQVEYSYSPDFAESTTVLGPLADQESGFTSKVSIGGLADDRLLFYRVSFIDRDDPSKVSAPEFGRFQTAPSTHTDIRFLWAGDTCGQGFGINPELGGLSIFERMLEKDPRFFIYSGDQIYADHPIPPVLLGAQGSSWKNVTTEAKSKVAEILEQFRGNYRYPLLDPAVRRFFQNVPRLDQWDDHEVYNNWDPSDVSLNDPAYQDKSAALIVPR